MNLVRKLVDMDTFIEGIPKEELKTILCQNHPSIRISTMRHGNIILSNNKIVKCISNYYALANGSQFKKAKTTNMCYDYQKQGDIQCPPYACMACHLQCLEKLKEGNLIIK